MRIYINKIYLYLRKNFLKCYNCLILFVAMPPAPTYPQQMMTQMCNDWQAPMYNVSANGHIPFVSGMTYAHPGYNLGAEMQDMNYGRENGRRHNNRGRSIRRDTYSRTLPANEVQTGYMGDQAQYHPQIPIMYIYPDHHSVSTQQHQVATGQIYYTSPMYSSILHPHPNAQSVSSNSHAHPTYPQLNHQAPQMNTCVRQSQSVPSQQSNQESMNQQPIVKSHDKHVQSTSDKLVHQVNENNSLQSNVINTVVINNSTSESSVKTVDENTANKQNVISSEKVDAKVQNNVVWTVNENCNGTDKVSYVNTTNDVKVNQNNETDKKLKNETVPIITTNTVKTSPKSISVKTDKNEAQIEENTALKDIQDKTITKTPDSSSAMPNSPDSLTTPDTPSLSTPEAPPTTTIVRSYASIVRKDNTSETHSCKPVAHTVQQNESPKTTVQKESTSPIRTPENQNDSPSVVPALQNGILQNCYDDPNTYRIGGKYKKRSNLLE